MTAHDAAVFSALLDRMLDVPPDERDQWLDALDPAYAAFVPRLRALAARGAAAQAGRALETLPKLGPGPAALSGLAAGALLDHHRLLRKLGSGGMAVVWLARDERAAGSPLVALKIARAQSERDPAYSRMEREQRLLEALEHPNIARLYAAGRSPSGQRYLVLEYVAGVTIDRYCSERKLGLAQRLALCVQLADALAHAHAQHIVHRDLKPANVLVTRDGETRLLDFGVAKLLPGPGLGSLGLLSAQTGRPVTPAYAAPEQLAGGEPTFASDLYSLGMMLYELSTGVRPFAHLRGSNRALREAILSELPPPPSSVATDSLVRAQLSGGIDQLILRALHKRPEQRQVSMPAFAAELEACTRALVRQAQNA